MEPRPVTEHPAPEYPTRREFLETGGAAALLATTGGCGDVERLHPLVAPIFEHGEGRGSIGCVVVSPPVFLSEEEALQVIKEELTEVGIRLGPGRELTEVTVKYVDPWQRKRMDGDSWFGESAAAGTGKASLAAIDPENQVGIEFVAAWDCDRFAGGVFSTVSTYETKDLAKHIAAAIRDQGRGGLRIGLFYDPLAHCDWDWSDADDPLPAEIAEAGSEQVSADNANREPGERDLDGWNQRFDRIEKSARRQAKDQLRRQARDFVAWLRQHPQSG